MSVHLGHLNIGYNCGYAICNIAVVARKLRYIVPRLFSVGERADLLKAYIRKAVYYHLVEELRILDYYDMLFSCHCRSLCIFGTLEIKSCRLVYIAYYLLKVKDNKNLSVNLCYTGSYAGSRIARNLRGLFDSCPTYALYALHCRNVKAYIHSVELADYE